MGMTYGSMVSGRFRSFLVASFMGVSCQFLVVGFEGFNPMPYYKYGCSCCHWEFDFGEVSQVGFVLVISSEARSEVGNRFADNDFRFLTPLRCVQNDSRWRALRSK